MCAGIVGGNAVRVHKCAGADVGMNATSGFGNGASEKLTSTMQAEPQRPVCVAEICVAREGRVEGSSNKDGRACMQNNAPVRVTCPSSQ